MSAIPLYHVWDYTGVDRAFWQEHLESFLPKKIFDAHTHIANPSLRIRPMTEEMRKQYWVNELDEPISAEDSECCIKTVFPNRDVKCLVFGVVSFDYDIEKSNEYVRVESVKRNWHCLTVIRPQWSAEKVVAELSKPGVIGVKPYYSLIGDDKTTRDAHLEADIFDFLPHHILEVLDERHAWVTLHVPKADRLGHPDNVRQIKELRKSYPDIILVIAHLGRCYTEPHALGALPQLADDPSIYFDTSAVMNPDVHRIALKYIGPDRLLYGTDNPVFYMRGRRQYKGRTYINRTNYPFYFNKEREVPEIEAKYTLYMYEELKALKVACQEAGITSEQVKKIFHDNANRLIDAVYQAKKEW